MNANDWKAMGEALGWIEVACDPDPDGVQEPCLFHAELDRVWPLGDWEGAVRDLGMDDEDFAELCASQAA